MLSSTGYEAVGYFRSRYQPENETHPDIQLMLVTSLYGSALSNDRLKALRSKLNLNHKVPLVVDDLIDNVTVITAVNDTWECMRYLRCVYNKALYKSTFTFMSENWPKNQENRFIANFTFVNMRHLLSI